MPIMIPLKDLWTFWKINYNNLFQVSRCWIGPAEQGGSKSFRMPPRKHVWNSAVAAVQVSLDVIYCGCHTILISWWKSILEKRQVQNELNNNALIKSELYHRSFLLRSLPISPVLQGLWNRGGQGVQHCEKNITNIDLFTIFWVSLAIYCQSKCR